MSIVEVAQGQALADHLMATAQTVDDGHQSDGNEVTERVFMNFRQEERDGRAISLGLTIDEISHDLFALTGDFPRRVGEKLFCRTADHKVLWLNTQQKLFAWIDRQAKVIWASGNDKIPQERFFAHLQMTAREYDAVELVPHFPELPNTYYIHPPLADADGSYLRNLLQCFSPATPIDGQLIKAFFMSLLWGGGFGCRPAWLFTGADDDDQGRGRGIGKSTLSKLASILVGGFAEISQSESIEKVKTRLLSSSARNLRIARLDNIKTHRFSWGELEGLITSPVISGHELYQGEGRRPNSLTWVLTLNGASLSTDMAQRCVIVQLSRPLHSASWESETRQFIEQHRWDIISDIIQELQS